MNKSKVRISTFNIILLILTFYEVSGVSHLFFLVFKYGIILYLIISNIKNLMEVKSVFIPIMIYGGITLLSTILNQVLFTKSFAAFFYMLHLLAIYLAITSFIKKRGTAELIKILIKILLVIIIITDGLMLLVRYNFDSPATNYFIGNKFAVSYLHCFVVALLYIFDTKRKSNFVFQFSILRLLFLFYSIFVCAKVTCTTGILICILMGMIVYVPFPNKFKEIISNPISAIGITFLVNVLIFGSFSLLTNDYVAKFISDVLGKSGTWIGRINIYAMILDVIKVHPWIGYGYFSNIIQDELGFGNAQNGVFKIIIDSGIIGLSGYVLMVKNSLRNYFSSSKDLWPLIGFVYCMIIASFAEINLTDYLMFLCIAIVYANEAISSYQKYKE